MSRASARPAVRVSAQEDDEVALLEKALSMAKERIVKAKEAAKAAPAAAAGGDGGYAGAAFTVKTFNAISPVGLKRFPSGKYAVAGELNQLPASPMAIMLRSHNLKPEEVAPTVRCIVRCGAGTNNIPVPKMTELGIPVFNTPGANANAVKELVVCSLLLASRGIVEGNAHVNNVINKEENVSTVHRCQKGQIYARRTYTFLVSCVRHHCSRDAVHTHETRVTSGTMSHSYLSFIPAVHTCCSLTALSYPYVLRWTTRRLPSASRRTRPCSSAPRSRARRLA